MVDRAVSLYGFQDLRISRARFTCMGIWTPVLTMTRNLPSPRGNQAGELYCSFVYHQRSPVMHASLSMLLSVFRELRKSGQCFLLVWKTVSALLRTPHGPYSSADFLSGGEDTPFEPTGTGERYGPPSNIRSLLQFLVPFFESRYNSSRLSLTLRVIFKFSCVLNQTCYLQHGS